MQAAAFWCAANPQLWEGKVVKRYRPMQVSLAWANLARELKKAGIYAPSYALWDFRLDRILAIAKEIRRLA